MYFNFPKGYLYPVEERNDLVIVRDPLEIKSVYKRSIEEEIDSEYVQSEILQKIEELDSDEIDNLE